MALENPVSELKQPSKLRWSELDDDSEDLDFLLPPRQVIGPDTNGIKKVIEYKLSDDGRKVKITTTTRLRKLANVQFSKQTIERRALAKFGDAVHEDVGSRLTMVSTEEILLEQPPAPEKATGDALGKGGGVVIVCRSCGKKGDHWTSRCPHKDSAESIVDKPPGSDTVVSSGGEKGTYVPPRRRNEENSVRVSNLSQDTREADLLELFGSFGPVSRVYVAVDQKTGVSRGFGFVNFVNKEDAERGILKLNGYGYDNLILRVYWATPRAN